MYLIPKVDGDGGDAEPEPEPKGHPHYADLSDIGDYGHNQTPIQYPFTRDPAMAKACRERIGGINHAQIPNVCVPPYNLSTVTGQQRSQAAFIYPTVCGPLGLE